MKGPALLAAACDDMVAIYRVITERVGMHAAYVQARRVKGSCRPVSPADSDETALWGFCLRTSAMFAFAMLLRLLLFQGSRVWIEKGQGMPLTARMVRKTNVSAQHPHLCFKPCRLAVLLS